MKTLATFSALILTMFLLSLNSGFAANNNDRNDQQTTAVQVMHKVVVHLGAEVPFCNTYQVEIVDAAGNFVAPPVIYHRGITTYKFFEQTRQTKALRIARLTMVPNGPHAIGPNILITTPDAKIIDFREGETYQFDLFPRVGTIKTVSQ